MQLKLTPGKPKRRRIIFLCDIDGTISMYLPHIDDFLHPNHEITPIAQGIKEDARLKPPESMTEDLYQHGIINLLEISRVFETACSNDKAGEPKFELMILTSGRWSRNSYLNFLANNLRVNEKTKKRILDARYHSAATDAMYFYKDRCSIEEFMERVEKMPEKERTAAMNELDALIDRLRNMPKTQRLKLILDNNPELKGGIWVALEDNFDHIREYQKDERQHAQEKVVDGIVLSVHAKTRKDTNGSKDCYNKTEENLETAFRVVNKSAKANSFNAQFFQSQEKKLDEPEKDTKLELQDATDTSDNENILDPDLVENFSVL